MPAFLKLQHFIVWHCLSPSLQLQQIPFRGVSGAILPVSILSLSFPSLSNSHPLPIGFKTDASNDKLKMFSKRMLYSCIFCWRKAIRVNFALWCSESGIYYASLFKMSILPAIRDLHCFNSSNLNFRFCRNYTCEWIPIEDFNAKPLYFWCISPI